MVQLGIGLKRWPRDEADKKGAEEGTDATWRSTPCAGIDIPAQYATHTGNRAGKRDLL